MKPEVGDNQRSFSQECWRERMKREGGTSFIVNGLKQGRRDEG